MSDGIPNMGALRARRPEIQAVPVDCFVVHKQATGELHHPQVDTVWGRLLMHRSVRQYAHTIADTHLAPRRLLLDDLHTICWVLHAAQSFDLKSWVPISISSMRTTSRELIDRLNTFR